MYRRQRAQLPTQEARNEACPGLEFLLSQECENIQLFTFRAQQVSVKFHPSPIRLPKLRAYRESRPTGRQHKVSMQKVARAKSSHRRRKTAPQEATFRHTQPCHHPPRTAQAKARHHLLNFSIYELISQHTRHTRQRSLRKTPTERPPLLLSITAISKEKGPFLIQRHQLSSTMSSRPIWQLRVLCTLSLQCQCSKGFTSLWWVYRQKRYPSRQAK